MRRHGGDADLDQMLWDGSQGREGVRERVSEPGMRAVIEMLPHLKANFFSLFSGLRLFHTKL